MHHTRRLTIAGTALATMALTFSSIGVVAQDTAVGVPAVPTGYAELDQALTETKTNDDGTTSPIFGGTRVTMQTQWIAGEGDNFAAALAPFEAATGIDVTVAEVPSGQHETLVNVSLNGGAAAEIIQLAQPAAILEYGAQGRLVDISTMLDGDKLLAEHPATVPLYSDGEQMFGMPYKVDVKSVVWYPINAFAEAGYEVPTTWDELIALSDRIVADGSSPWCVGMDAAAATGWIATDMIEDILLRTAPVDVYNSWALLQHPFDSPEVKNAFDLAGQIYFTPDYVLGGSTGILATSQNDAMDPMFDGDPPLSAPSCWLQKQATWYGPDFFPDRKATGESSEFVVGEDVGLFYFPPIDPELGNPALGAGDAFIVTADRPEIRAVLQYLALPEGIQTWIAAGSAISANQSTPADWYAGNYKLEIASGIVANATSFGFDASDLMPSSGAAFWAGVVDWISNDGTNTDAVLAAIDAAHGVE